MGNALMRELRTNFTAMISKQGAIMFLCLSIIMITSNGQNLFTYYMIFFGILTLGYTEVEVRDRVYISLLSSPCTRKDYVVAKFLGGIIWIIFLFVSGVLLNMLANKLIPMMCGPINMAGAKMISIYMLLLVELYYLLYFTLGIKFSRIAYYVIFFIMIIGSSTVASVFDNDDISSELLLKIVKIFSGDILLNNIILIVLAGLIITLFTCISMFIFEKKDL
ncbi:ABC-2 transporter permease [Clostridium sp.]|uniref:ABC-2 transporter permease n=1 Tax=Clostridium sp. TaxID=1506 RepID=UPI00321751D6